MSFSFGTLDLEPTSSQASFRSTHSDASDDYKPQQPPNQVAWAAVHSAPSPPQPTRVRQLSHTEETAVDSLLAMQLSRGRGSSCDETPFAPAFCFSGVAPGALAAR